MKSQLFTILAIEAMMLVTPGNKANACGPYYDQIPQMSYFTLYNHTGKAMADYDKSENLLLWQSMTCDRIPLSDIERAVYKDSWQMVSGANETACATDNLFYRYLKNERLQEVFDFLMTAKNVEAACRKTAEKSPWYYPTSRDQSEEVNEIDYLNDVIDYNMIHNEGRINLDDRYGLQKTRILFYTRRYEKCIELVDSFYAQYPQDNLMRRMATRYVAGSWYRLGNKARADSLYASIGDIWSLSTDEPMAYMAKVNPTAPQLMDYIRENAADESFLRKALEVADQILATRGVSHRGDWYFLKAYGAYRLDNDSQLARKYVTKALKEKFASEELESQAKMYKIKMDLSCGDYSNLVRDLRRIVDERDPLSADCESNRARICNAIYVDAIPVLWEKGDYATAIYLCAYADKLYYPNTTSVRYGSLTTQLMESLTSDQLISVYKTMGGNKPLYNYLRKTVPLSRDYVYELIGTLALREANYQRAEYYLSRVSEPYLQSMKIYRDGYLRRDAFKPYPTRWVEDSYGDYTWCEVTSTSRSEDRNPLDPYAKVKFAQKMRAYKKTMDSDPDVDKRAMARLMYAIGRRNSMSECWALTQYSDGNTLSVFKPTIYSYDDEFRSEKYYFLHENATAKDYKQIEQNYQDEVKAAMDMFATDNARAEAEYMMGNLATVVKRYKNTPTAQYVRGHCDNWRSWL